MSGGIGVGAASGWLAWMLTVLLALGGAAARPEGIVLGLPAAWATLAALAVTFGLVHFVGPAAGHVLNGLWPVVLGVVLGAALPGLRPFSGTILLAFALAGLVLVLPAEWLLRLRRVFFPAVLLLYVATAAQVQARVGPQGDEPHYLMVAESLLRDGDLAVERDFQEGRYRAFHPGTLAPHYRVRGHDGVIYSLHAVGLSVLILPAYAAAGYAGASFFMAFLAALLAREVRRLLAHAIDDPAMVDGLAWLLALSPPIVHYAGLVFTEVPAALLVAFVLRFNADNRSTWPRAFVSGVAIGVLPWLNVRYALLSGILILFVLARRPPARAVLALLVPALGSARALALFHEKLYGFLDPRRVYGARREFSLDVLPEGLPGLFLDQEFGLLVYAPLFVLALPGAWALARRAPRLAAACLTLIVGIVMVAAAWPMWRGGFNPPGRFLVPLLPALALLVAAGLKRGRTPAVALLAGWTVLAGLTAAVHPEWIHRDRQGTAPYFRGISGAEDWTRLLPGYVLEESRPDRLTLSLLWGAALLLAAAARHAPPRARNLALGCGALLAAGAVAQRVSTASVTGRTAVPVLGRRALALPQGTWEGSARAEWDAARLPWGGVYEPHRHPGGAVLGERLRIPQGPHGIELDLREGWPLGSLPFLEVHVQGRSVSEAPLTAQPGHLAGEIPAGPEEVTLVLRGGGAVALGRIRVGVQPSGDLPVQSVEGFKPRGGVLVHGVDESRRLDDVPSPGEDSRSGRVVAERGRPPGRRGVPER